MPDYAKRPYPYSVLFVDIVGYSKNRSVAEQIRLKEQFNELVTKAISGVAADERIILDTGDGAAVCFLGDLEDAMFAGLSLRDAVANQDATVSSPLRIRVGINFGPVKLVKDLNGRQNIVGDGINVAQRVMSFAEPGQILVSRSYHEQIVHLSEDYARLFQYEGPMTDKHLREHFVYSIIAAPGIIVRTAPVSTPKLSRRLPSFTVPKLRAPDFRIPEVTLRPLAARLSVNSKLLVAAPLAFILIVSSGVIARSHRTAGEEKTVPSKVDPPAKLSTADPAPATGPSAPDAEKDSQASPETEPPPPPAKSSRRLPKKTHGAETLAVAKTPSLLRPDKAKAPPLAARAREAAEMPAAPREPEIPAAPRASMQEATLSVVALPWAEVYVDGTKLGVSPPLRSIPVKPGKHKVELRNSSFPAHVETVEAKAGTEVSIRHRFLR